MADLFLPLLVLTLGQIAHILKKVSELHRQDDQVTIRSYLRDRPYKSALALCGGLAGFVALYDTGQLTLLTAFGVGYLADSALDALGGNAQRRIQQ